MPPVRIPEIPGLAHTPVNAPKVSQGAATAPARALGEVAAGIARLGQPFAEIADRTQRAENARLEIETRGAWNRQLAELNLKLQKESDPAEFTRQTDALLSQLKGGIDPSLPPAVRDRLTREYSEFADRAMIGAAAESAKLAQKRARLALDNDVQMAANTGDRDLYMKARQTATDSGILLPEEAVAMDREFSTRAIYQQLASKIDADPAAMEDLLEDTSSPEARAAVEQLGPENLERLRRQAHIAANAERAELWDGVLNQALNDGPDQVILAKEELRRLAEEGSISPEQRAAYLNAYHGETPPPFDPQIYNEAFGAISTYDPANDPTGATLAQLRGSLATLQLPKESVAELRDRLNDRAKPENPAAHKLSGDFAKLTKESFDGGRFGNWFSYRDHDDDWRTVDAKVINFADYGRALATKRRFTDTFETWLRNQGDEVDPVKAQETYDQLFERIVLDNDDPAAAPLVPGAPPLIDFGRDVDKLLGTPATGAGKETGATTGAKPATFGGQPVRPPGVFYRNARPTIFGGTKDPADNGLSAFGGTTGEGGREGVAIPLDILKATFPGKDKAWFAENVRAVVKTDDGRSAVLPLADLGTAEHIWQKNGRPVLDLTPGAVKQLGGRPIYKDGKLAGIANIGSVSFALSTQNAGTEADLRTLTWQQAQDSWFRAHKPTSADQIASGLAALKSAWLEAHARDIDPGPWGDGSGGSLLPELEESDGMVLPEKP
jgi:hypothetical protein